MNFGSIDDIRHSGFRGFLPISALQESKCCEVPDEPGVYLILRPKLKRPEFLVESVGGHSKNKGPRVKWVEGTVVLNIGKAGPGKSTLRSRLTKYMRFGQGKNSGHRGGRYIWQLRNSSDLLVCWKATGDAVPRIVEKALIEEFRAAYGKLPFANLTR